MDDERKKMIYAVHCAMQDAIGAWLGPNIARLVVETAEPFIMEEALKRGFALGFQASGEGWNAEYPFSFDEYETDKYWIEKRNNAIAKELGKEA